MTSIKTIILPLSLALAAGCGDSGVNPEDPEEIEARIIRHLEDNLRPGQPVIVSELFNDVFSTPAEQEVLARLFDTVFRIPLFLVQFQSSTGAPPTLEEIAEQFDFRVPGEAEVILSVMESDPRIPPFFTRDPDSGEIAAVDVETILGDPQFGQEIRQGMAGWQGRAIPGFAMETFEGGQIRSEDLAGRPYMIYVWFSNCPPCLETSPLLVSLYEEYAGRDFEIVAANADRVLDLPYDDDVRSAYVEASGIRFVTSHLTEAVQDSLGGVTVFPTMFFVDREGIVVRHLISFQDEGVLRDAIEATL